MNRKGLIYSVAFVVIVAIAVVAVYSTVTKQAGKEDTEKEVFDPEPDPDVEQISFHDERRMNRQKLIERKLVKEYDEGTYSFDDPFIKLDPYEAMPLTALVMFKTEEPVQINVVVEGQDESTSIEKSFEGYATEHEIPVLGLYPDEENTVTIEATNEEGEAKTTELKIQTEALPDDFVQPDLVEAKPEKMENGLTFMIPTQRYIYAVDDNADVRWYSTLPIKLIFDRLENGNILYVTQDEARDQYNELLEMDMLGKVSNAYMFQIDGYDKPNVIHHDVIEMPNGNLLATLHEPNADYVQDQMYEIDRETGETVQNINMRDVFPNASYEEYDGKNADEGDWLHQNAIWFDERDNSILISGRSQDLIMKLSYPDGEIKWILGADEEWQDEYKQYLLNPKNDVKFPAGQHAMKILPDKDDNPDTIDVLLFDNNEIITRGDEEISGTYSRGVQYRVNEKDKTVEEVWSYGEERGAAYFSTILGNTQYLYDTGNRLITSGYIQDQADENATTSRIIEVNDQDPADVIYEIVTPTFDKDTSRYIYRAVRLPLYPKSEWDFTIRVG